MKLGVLKLVIAGLIVAVAIACPLVHAQPAAPQHTPSAEAEEQLELEQELIEALFDGNGAWAAELREQLDSMEYTNDPEKADPGDYSDAITDLLRIVGIWALLFYFYRKHKSPKPSQAATQATQGQPDPEDDLAEHRAAAAYYKQATTRDPNDAEAYFKWGLALDKLGEPFRACEQFQTSIALNPNDAGVYCNWGFTLYSAGEYKAACEKYQAATDLVPTYAEAYYFWALALQKLEDYEGVCEACQMAIRLRPDDDYALYEWGLALHKTGNPEAACEQYAKAAELNPAVAWVHYAWGDALKDMNEYAKACEKFQVAIQLDPNDDAAHSMWGLALYSLKEYDKAIEHWTAAEEHWPGDQAYNLACAYAHKGDDGEVRKWLEFSKEKGMLVDKEHGMADEDLEKYRDEDWFAALWDDEK